MVCQQRFYVLPLLAYTEFIKPKLVQYYGPINWFAILRQEQRKKQFGKLMSTLESGDFGSFFRGKGSDSGETPFKRFFKAKEYPEYYGSEDSELYGKIDNLLRDKSIYSYNDQSTHFIRTDQLLSTIDHFESEYRYVKVSDIDQVRNFLQYIEVIKKAYVKEGSTSLRKEYNGFTYAEQVLKQALKNMEDSRKKTVLIVESTL